MKLSYVYILLLLLLCDRTRGQEPAPYFDSIETVQGLLYYPETMPPESPVLYQRFQHKAAHNDSLADERYDKDGYIKEFAWYGETPGAKKPLSVTRYTYTNDRRTITETTDRSVQNDWAVTKQIYEYDTGKRLVATRIYRASGSDPQLVEYSYDAQSRLVRVTSSQNKKTSLLHHYVYSDAPRQDILARMQGRYDEWYGQIKSSGYKPDKRIKAAFAPGHKNRWRLDEAQTIIDMYDSVTTDEYFLVAGRSTIFSVSWSFWPRYSGGVSGEANLFERDEAGHLEARYTLSYTHNGGRPFSRQSILRHTKYGWYCGGNCDWDGNGAIKITAWHPGDLF